MARIPDLLAAGRTGWFGELESSLLDAWSPPDVDFFDDQLAIRTRCLLISDDEGGSGHYLLVRPDQYFAALVTELWRKYTNG